MSSFIPATIYPIVPKIAIGTPHAADVPIADVKLSPEALKYGTEKVPPPMPRIDERKPIKDPANTDTILFILISFEKILILNKVCIPMISIKIAIINFNNIPSI